MTEIRVLHLDDDAMILHGIEYALTRLNWGADFKVLGVTGVDELLCKLTDFKPDCILLDLHIDDDDGGGLAALRAIRAAHYGQPILILSSDDHSTQIKAAMEAGASDFLIKSEDVSELALRISCVLSRDSVAKPQLNAPSLQIGGGTMNRIAKRLKKIAASRVTSILVRGETGTGKEVVSECLRSLLPTGTPFITVNCAAINQSVMESELFGHEKGAFTGATSGRVGLFAAADRGWVFLDEVARLTPACQAALLRVLDSGEIRPVGSSHARHVAIRVMAATNEDLDDMVAKGLFRSDLLARLAGVEVFIPPIRDRAEEIPDILDALIAKLNLSVRSSLASGQTEYRIAQAAKALLAAYDWRRGNVREMRQVLLTATIEAADGVISVPCLPERFLGRSDGQKSKAPELKLVPGTATSLLDETLVQAFPASLPALEGALLLRLIDTLAKRQPINLMTQRNLAHNLGITRYTLFAKLRQLATDGQLPAHLHFLLPVGERLTAVESARRGL